MISSVCGVVLSAGLDSVVIDVGGVGLLLHTTAGTAASLSPGGKALLATTLVVREESLTLYGFADEDERTVFSLVQTVSGVGPRLALAMLAIHTPDGLRRAVSGGDLVALTKVPGIGKKTAERLLLELKGKLGADLGAMGGTVHSDATADILNALVALGYSDKEAMLALKQVPAGSGVSDGIKLALRALSKG